MTLTFDLLTPKSIGHILDSWGASVWSFMIIGGLHSQLWSGNHFQTSIIHDLDLWPFDPKINRAHPWLMGSKCMKFHYYISKGIWLTVRKPIVDARPPARPPHIRLRAEFCNSAKNNWELSNISLTMKRNLLKFSILIEQSFSHKPSKERTPSHF